MRAIVHTHQVYASALAIMNAPIPALFDEQVRFLGRSVEIVNYAPSGTGFLKKQIVSKLGNHCNAYILQNHGALCLGITAENVAEKFKISREEQDEFALRSQERAHAAIAAGRFVDEILPRRKT